MKTIEYNNLFKNKCDNEIRNSEEQEIDMDIDNHNFGEVKHVSDTDESCVVFTSVVIY